MDGGGQSDVVVEHRGRDVAVGELQPKRQQRLDGSEGEHAPAVRSGPQDGTGAARKNYDRQCKSSPGHGRVGRRVMQPSGQSDAGYREPDRAYGGTACGANECVMNRHVRTIMTHHERAAAP
ncbi:hypothetical protein GCM10010255_12360 [Streptomyces coeruleofuscus]|uniref:Uncharacterized protein n=1 Tax=Streptomyces coeruleofuscus TaxID=66879 RepID=A0ABN3HS61_9ACTN